ncbi:unnamed protein product [Oreochromis niloticus]|nr:unnamed protein product [Mustela putorius furo]
MSEAEVVYSDVKFTRGKVGANEGPQQAVVNKGSKVTSERVLLVVLSVLLAAAVIALCFTTFKIIKTNKELKNLEGHKMKCERNFTETLSKIQPCSTVQPTCPGPKVIDDPCYKCEEGWEQHGEKCYYFSIRNSSWNQSRDECRAKGGDLVKIDSREEQTFLQRRLKYVMTEAEDKFWIGLTDSAVEGRWVWADGSSLNESLKFWNRNEPDNWNGTNGIHPGGEDCARMGEKGGAKDLKCWFDAFCSKPHRSICEKAGAKGQIKKVCD